MDYFRFISPRESFGQSTTDLVKMHIKYVHRQEYNSAVSSAVLYYQIMQSPETFQEFTREI